MRHWCFNYAVGSSKLIFICNSLFRVSIGSLVRQDLFYRPLSTRKYTKTATDDGGHSFGNSGLTPQN